MAFDDNAADLVCSGGSMVKNHWSRKTICFPHLIHLCTGRTGKEPIFIVLTFKRGTNYKYNNMAKRYSGVTITHIQDPVIWTEEYSQEIFFKGTVT